mmetsp:Transcript_17696/g.39229  ORF Transcript_17696/g.39229 Transcript_17696/m.39229 type:complete len:140 (-) Transcript_17696:464-883(-)
MGDAVDNGWFAPYDWIVRLNPDVLIRDDEFLLRTMRNESVDGIFAMCPNPGRVHTDFFAVRPKVIAEGAFHCPQLPPHFTAELQAMDEFGPIIKAKRHVWLPNVRHNGVACRILGRDAPVVHDHALLDQCRNGHARLGG